MRTALILIILSLVAISGCVQEEAEALDAESIGTSDASLTVSKRLSAGDANAIPEAIELLDSNKLVTDLEPPKLEREFIFYDLNRYTGLDFGYDPYSTDRSASIQQWRSWWNQNKNSIIWDGTKYVVQ